MLQRELIVSQDTLLRALSWENLAEPHPVLIGVEYYRDEEAEREADQQAWAELGRLGLLEGNRLAPDFRDCLVVLSRPGNEFYAWIVGGKEDSDVVGILVAAIGRDALTVTRAQGQVRITPARPETPAETLIAQLPEHPPARAQSISVARAEYEQTTGSTGEVRLTDAPNRTSPEARRLRSLLEEPRTRMIQLGTAARDRSARRRRDKFAILDVDSGRWVNHLTGGGKQGDEWIVAAPATPQLLTRLLYERQQAFRDN